MSINILIIFQALIAASWPSYLLTIDFILAIKEFEIVEPGVPFTNLSFAQSQFLYHRLFVLIPIGDT